MKTVLSLALLMPFGCLAAQVTVTSTAATPIALLATATSSSPALFGGIPAGADTTAFSVQLPTVIAPILNGYTANSGTANPYYYTSFFHGNNGFPAPGQTVGLSSSPSAAGASFGPVDQLVVFRAFAGASGTIGIEAIVATLPAQSTNDLLIDIGDDGSFEVTSAGTSAFPVVMNSNGEIIVRIRRAIEFDSTSPLLVNNTVAMNFQLDPISSCSITPGIPGCGGAQSVGAETVVGVMRTITLSAGGLFPQSVAVSTFGAPNFGVVLSPGCVLRNDAQIVLPLFTDASGYAVHTVTLAATTTGMLNQQFVSLDLSTLDFRVTNSLGITCLP